MDQSSLQTDHKWIKLDYITCITYKSKCCRSHFYFYFTFSYFCRRIHNCAPIVGWVGRGGRRGGAKVFLAMPVFFLHLLLPPFPSEVFTINMYKLCNEKCVAVKSTSWNLFLGSTSAVQQLTGIFKVKALKGRVQWYLLDLQTEHICPPVRKARVTYGRGNTFRGNHPQSTKLGERR